MKGIIDDTMSQMDKSLLRMASMVEDLLNKVEAHALDKKDSKLDELKVESTDIEIESRDMEALCLRIILRRHPVAKDLRKVTAATHIVNDLERIGNNAFDLAEVCSFVDEKGVLEDAGIRLMIGNVRKMLKMSIDSYLSSDVSKSQEVVDADDVLDKRFVKAKDELTDSIKRGAEGVEFAPDVLLATKYLERMGDHAVNIARQIIWAETGIGD